MVTLKLRLYKWKMSFVLFLLKKLVRYTQLDDDDDLELPEPSVLSVQFLLGPEGMGDSLAAGEWSHREMRGNRGELVSVHVVPDEGFIHLMDRAGSCLCGTDMSVGEGATYVVHQALDPVFYDKDYAI